MKTEIIRSLVENFESHSNKTESGVEFWLARDLQKLLGYYEWRNFLVVLNKAKIACESAGNQVADQFVDVNKLIDMGKKAKRNIDDIMLTRYACYLVAQNGDPRKDEIAFAQNYFAVQTRKFEVIEKRIQEFERIVARQKLTESEKLLSGVIFQQTGNDKNFAVIRSKGDKALFGYTTAEMKNYLQIPNNRALSDFQPTILLKAKDFATEITIFNTKAKDLRTESSISSEHVTNNKSVRNTLIGRGITPEKLPREEDIQKVARKLKSVNKKNLTSSGSLK